MQDRRQLHELRDRLAAIQDGYLKVSRRVVLAHVFQAVVLVLSIVAVTLLLDEIQSQRREAIVANCEDVNRRHDDTITKLRRLVTDIPNPKRKARAQRNIDGTITLIEALTPRRDCERLADRYVGP